MSWFHETENGIVLRLLIQPKSAKSSAVGIHGDRLKIKIAAPPTDNQANEELLRFLKKFLKTKGVSFEIIRGQTSRSKDVLCLGLTRAELSVFFSDFGM